MGETYHPRITASSINKPPRNLTSGLDHQQAAKPFCELEERRRIRQHLIPSANRQDIIEPSGPKDPLRHTRLLGPLPPKSLRQPIPTRIRVDRKAIQAPYQQRRNNNPLRNPHDLHQRIPKPRLLGRHDPQRRVRKVEAEQRQRVRQPAVPPADIKGDGDGQDDGEQEHQRRDEPED